MNVTRDGAWTPSSPSTRTVSSLLVGSTIRPRTNARNASSRTAANPSASYRSLSAPHRIRELVASTTADPGSVRPCPGTSRSSTCWPAYSRRRAVSSSKASSSASCAEPTWSTSSATRPRLCTICTAVAPDAVGTLRTIQPTGARPPVEPGSFSAHFPR
jgi:hypothetical protein